MEFKRIFNYLAYSSIFVAITGIAVTYMALSLLLLPLSLELILIVFFVVFAVYNFNRITEIKEEDSINYPERVSFIKKHRKMLIILSYTSFILALIIAFSVNFGISLFIFIPLIGVSLYTLKPIKIKRFFSLKNIFVSFIWALSITFLPLLFFEKTFSLSSLGVFFYIFLKGLGNTIAFDIRDIKGDKIYQIKTLPMVLNLNELKILLAFINLISFIWIIIFTALGIFPHVGYFISLVMFYTLFYIYLINKTDLKFLTDIIVDGEFIVIGVLTFIGNSIVI